MTNVIVISAACVAIAIPLLLWSFSARPQEARDQALTNLQRGLPRPAGGDATLEAGGGGLARLARLLTPTGLVRKIDLLLARAGRPANWPLERILVTKLTLGAATTALVGLVVGTSPSARGIFFGLCFLALMWFLPEILLYNEGTKRRKKVQEALPDTLDQLSIAVDAGLGLESAMAHVARNSSGPLSEEIVRTLQDMQVGMPRHEAYLAMSQRVDVSDLRRFLRAMALADQQGVSISRVLNTQAQEMRLKRRQRAEEKAMKIPVKVVFPLILFILPVLFIVVMGPGVIGIIEAFSE
ncbi:type II secretion system F family protein [Ornithinimicrobium sp. EGI L100131]|nr:type II secretion system F family protein [Ornithinimicrobium sediminis]